MLFTSLDFFLFLPLVLAVFALTPVAQRWAVLLLASYVFYGFAQPFNLIYLGAVTLVVFACGWGLGQARQRRLRVAVFVIGLVAVLGSLTAFKFYDFLAGEIARANLLAGIKLPRLGVTAPAGYSFYAFSAASYLIDIYVGRLSGKQSLGQVALFTAYFPKIFAGPIERATNFLPQLVSGLHADPMRFALGLQLIGWGLIKKVVIADNLAPSGRSQLQDRRLRPAARTLDQHIFLRLPDLLRLFRLYRYRARHLLAVRPQADGEFPPAHICRAARRSSGRERWHISLGRWFRDYLYIPLGGSRAGLCAAQYINVMVVFLVSGLWHAGLGYGVGWTFLVWGALNGAYQWAGLATRGLWQRAGEALPRVRASAWLLVLRIVITFHLILISWVFFRATDRSTTRCSSCRRSARGSLTCRIC